ncbi:hypothetical protein [Flavobacterium sp. 3HN19-14]|uniref:hypothetical protein n=1 Tax=Flavobacterium sp. 3HN19-14 TaxID=3448133 RepID=UPI003EE2D796
MTDFFWEGSNNSAGATDLNDLIRKLIPGEMVTYTVTIEVPVTFTGNLVFKASAVSEGMPAIVGPPPVAALPAVSDPHPASNTNVTDTDIPANADISVVNTDFSTVYTLGRPSVYLITVKNSGPTDALNVAVKNAIPAGINPSDFSWVGSNGTSGSNIAVDDFIQLLHADETITYTVTVNVPADYGGYLVNTSYLYATSPDQPLLIRPALILMYRLLVLISLW